MATAVTREAARGRHHDYVLPNGTHIALDTYLGKNLVSLASEGGEAPQPPGAGTTYPMAYLVQQWADSEIQAHYHQADQFQLFVQGAGRIGTHALRGMTIHYANSLSPYGPIVSEGEGLRYLTFRNRWDPGAQWMPEKAQRLRDTPDRRHFTASHDIDAVPAGGTWRELLPETLPGLGAWLVHAGPDGVVRGREPSQGAGQFWYSLQGEMAVDDRVLEPNSVVFVASDEPALEVRGVGEGATLVVMQFPRSH